MSRGTAGLLLAGVLLTACTGGAADGVPLATLEPATLTACVALAPQLAEEGPDGLDGYDVAVLEAVATELDLELVTVPTSYDDVVAGVALHDHRCDLAAGGVVDTDALRAVAATSAPYRTVHRLVVATTPGTVVPAGEVTGTVGVESGGVAEDVAGALGTAEVVGYPSRTDLGRALEEGLVEGALVTRVGRTALEEQLGMPLVVRASVPSADETVLLLPLETDEDGLAAVDAAIATLADDGRLDALAATWLDR